ncbi:MAG: hypothetical protein V9E83_14685 [Baekduia sp.]
MSGGAHRGVTIVLSAVLVLIGVAILVRTIADAGFELTYGLVVGPCFVAAGAARLWLALKGPAR